MNIRQKNSINITLNALIFLLGMLFFGFISVRLGQDLNWDLANYHYSNAYLFLHHTRQQDLWPASYLHVHFPPTADLLSYFLITHFHPKMAIFISGMIHGINFFLIFLIARLFLTETTMGLFIALLLAFIGIYGGVGFADIGSFKNDFVICLFILSFIYCQIRSLQIIDNTFKDTTGNNKIEIFLQFTAGFLAGTAMGLKLTAIGYALGSSIALLLLRLPARTLFKLILLWGTGIICGMLFSSGYWMLILWKQYHNPFFPFLNHIFHSPNFPSTNWHFTQFTPKSFWQTVFYPIYFAFYGSISDGHFTDLRYFYLYLLLLATGIITIYQRLTQANYKKINITICWLCLFSVFTYVFCQYDSGSLRYMLAIEMLAPLIIYLLIIRLTKNSTLRCSCLFIILSSIIITMKPIYGQTRITSYQRDYFSVLLPPFIQAIPEAMVLMSYSEFSLYGDPRPVSFLTAFFPEKWHFVGIPFTNQLYNLTDNRIFIQAYNFINAYSGKIFIMAPQLNISEMYMAALRFNLIADGDCVVIDNIRSRLLKQNVLICPAKKLGIVSG